MHQTLLPFALLAASALAQNNTNTTAECPSSPHFNLDSPVNSSATVPIPHSNTSSSTEPWYLTVTMNDTRTNSSADTSVWAFLSTPANTTGDTCVYLMGKLLNAQSGMNGDCAGSLSENCVDAIRRSMTYTSADKAAGRCPDPPSLDTVKGACGDPLAQGWGGGSTGPIDQANTTCRDERVPGPNQPPEGYNVNGLFGISGFGADESDRSDPSKFTWYDRYVSRPFPWVVAHVDEDGESWTSVVCVTPGDVSEGSRDPGTSGAGRVGAAWTGAVVMGAVAVLGML